MKVFPTFRMWILGDAISASRFKSSKSESLGIVVGELYAQRGRAREQAYKTQVVFEYWSRVARRFAG